MTRSQGKLWANVTAMVLLWAGVYLAWRRVIASLEMPYLVVGIPHDLFKRGCVDTLLYIATTFFLLRLMERQGVLTLRALHIANGVKIGLSALLWAAIAAYLVGVFAYYLWAGSWMGNVLGKLVYLLIERENVCGASFVWPSIALYLLSK